MTVGHDPFDKGADGTPPEQERRPDAGAQTERLGPLPPRMEPRPAGWGTGPQPLVRPVMPPGTTGQLRAVPGRPPPTGSPAVPAYQPTSTGSPMLAGYGHPPAATQPPAGTRPPGGHPTGAYPSVGGHTSGSLPVARPPGPGLSEPGPGLSGPGPGLSGPGPGLSGPGPGLSGPGPGLSGPGGRAPAAAPGARFGGYLGIVAFGLALLLLAVAAVQTYLLVDVNRQLREAEREAAAARSGADGRDAALESRLRELEKRTGGALDAAAVAKDVLPSVFRVSAGNAGGSAFAVGKEPPTGGTDLITNFHVVEELFRGGGRDVFLQHRDERYPARIEKVDQSRDLALLHTGETFPRLTPATTAAQAGEPVLVVGAPLGLENSVTQGVISALRNTADGPLLQFDAPINPGNSGGPVINAQRQVVGIVTKKARDAEGISIAIPVAVACQSFGMC